VEQHRTPSPDVALLLQCVDQFVQRVMFGLEKAFFDAAVFNRNLEIGEDECLLQQTIHLV